jgi:hypothetical protein
MKEAEVRLYHKKSLSFCEAKLSCVVLRGLLRRYNTCAELVQFLYMIKRVRYSDYATGWTPDHSSFDPWQGEEFSKASTPALVSTQPRIQ